MAFKMNEWSAFTKNDSDKKNKQNIFNNKVDELRRAWRSIKDPNSNRAKQLKKEAKTIGLTLSDQSQGDDDPNNMIY